MSALFALAHHKLARPPADDLAVAVPGQQRGEVADFQHAFERAVDGIKADLAQAEVVSRAAVSPIVRSFVGIEEVLALQSRVLHTITRSLKTDGGNSARSPLLGSTAKLLNQFVDLVVCVGGNSMQIIERLMVLANHVDAMSNTTVGIDQLARESRFVAFNARIQTIRAGDKGLTFKVIADEVKRLASRSAELSSHIRAEVTATAQSVAFIRESAVMLASHDMNTAIESRALLLNVIGRLDEVNARLQTTIADVGLLVKSASRALHFEVQVSDIIRSTSRTLDALALLSVRATRTLATHEPAERSGLDQLTASFLQLATSYGDTRQARPKG